MTILGTDAVAELLGVKPRTVRSWFWRGCLKVHRRGSKRAQMRITKHALLAFLETRTGKPYRSRMPGLILAQRP